MIWFSVGALPYSIKTCALIFAGFFRYTIDFAYVNGVVCSIATVSIVSTLVLLSGGLLFPKLPHRFTIDHLNRAILPTLRFALIEIAAGFGIGRLHRAANACNGFVVADYFIFRHFWLSPFPIRCILPIPKIK